MEEALPLATAASPIITFLEVLAVPLAPQASTQKLAHFFVPFALLHVLHVSVLLATALLVSQASIQMVQAGACPAYLIVLTVPIQ